VVGPDLQIEQDVQQPGIDRMHLIGTEIPQKMVDVFETRREIVAVLKIHRRKRLARMSVNERQ